MRVPVARLAALLAAVALTAGTAFPQRSDSGRHERNRAGAFDYYVLALSWSRMLWQIAVEERPFTVSELKAAREAFLTSTSSHVLPVTSVDGAQIGDGRPGPVTMRLRELYLAALDRR